MLLGADVLLTMGDDELMEIGDTLSAFIVTILLQKMIHITAEVREGGKEGGREGEIESVSELDWLVCHNVF